jgi:hypothetical protein
MLQGDSNTYSTVEDIQDPVPSPRCGRRVSWFDVGGLLEHTAVAPSPTDSVIAHDFATQPRRGSRANSLPNGRAFLPPVRRNSRLSQQSEDYEMTVRPTHQLQDLGGLLSEDREREEAESTTSPNSGSSAGVPARYERGTLMQRTSTRSTRTSYDVPSLHDAGGLLSSAPHTTSIRRTTSYDVPSLHDAGGLLSSTPHTTSIRRTPTHQNRDASFLQDAGGLLG